MSLRLEPINPLPAETVRVAHAAFPKGTMVTRLRDEFNVLYQDEDFYRSAMSQYHHRLVLPSARRSPACWPSCRWTWMPG